MVTVDTRAIYCVVDAQFFLGAVATINSLRLCGHREPIFALDCGLESWQKRLLTREATVTAASAGGAPHLLKHVLPLAEPAETMILVDTDIIVTRSLEPLIAAAAEKVVAFADVLDRFD